MAFMDVEDLLNLIQNPGDDGIPDTVYDDIRGAFSSQSENAAAKVAELEATIAALTADNARLKAHNYDLLTAPVTDAENGTENENGPDTDTVEDDTTTIDDLFGKD